MPSAALTAPEFQITVIEKLDERLERVRSLKGTHPDYVTVERAVWEALSNEYSYGLCADMLRVMHGAGELRAVANQGEREGRMFDSWRELLAHGPDALNPAQLEDVSDLLFHALKDIRYGVPFELRGSGFTNSTVSDAQIDAIVDQVREEVIAFSRTATHKNENEAFVSFRCSLSGDDTFLDMRLRDGAPVLLDRATQEVAPEALNHPRP